jgi:hypothetical protein
VRGRQSFHGFDQFALVQIGEAESRERLRQLVEGISASRIPPARE